MSRPLPQQLFANSGDVQVNGGHFKFTLHGPNQKADVGAGLLGFEILRQNIASGAIHDSGERFEPPTCDPDTRVAIIESILAWVNDSERSSSMLWLRGSLGVGKSTLAQTIAEHCSKKQCLAGSFFFSRTASNWNDGRLLISTLSYQLTSTFPAARSIIKKIVSRDPLVLQLSLESQMQNLFTEPINRVARSLIRRYITHYTRSHPRLVIIDGLDECSDPAVQCEILRVLGSTLKSLRFPFRFLITSRPEIHITRAFNQLRPGISLSEIDLSKDALQADLDIRSFFRGRFNNIREMHPLGQFLSHVWPTDENVDELVRRSSGQFIYPSVVIRYISSPKHQPVERLNNILGLSPRLVKDFPFAQLDGLYTYILGSVDDNDIEIVLRILGIFTIPRTKDDHFGDHSTPARLELLLSLQPGDIGLLLNDLLSVITVVSRTEPIRISHASLTDFLLDQSRANRFYIDIGLSHTTLASGYMNVVTTMLESTDSDWDPILAHLKKAVLTESLRRDLLCFQFLTIFDRVKSLSTATPSDLNGTPKPALADYIWGWLTEFLGCFDNQSTLFDRKASEEIYAHLLLHLDTYLKNQLARCTVDDEFMDLLTLSTVPNRRAQAELPHPRFSSILYLESTNAREPPSWYLDQCFWDVDDVVLHVLLILSGFTQYSKSHVRTSGYCGLMRTAQPIRENVLEPLRRFLLDPDRSGDYCVDGAKYARSALRCLRQLYRPRTRFLHQEQITVLCIATRRLLSNAAMTEALVAFLTRANHFSRKPPLCIRFGDKASVDRLATEVQTYLKR